ncbi:MAG TPA: TonB-dependent receptor [Thermoanaerobaculia bacterium]|nr:TonB-dependent receptor [Thermoanaerobaculia bacterium]
MEIDWTMKSSNLWARAFAFAAIALLVAGGAYAQLQTGNLYGTVTDQQGAALPGVTVTVTGGGAPQVQVTNANGQFRFLGLAPGGYGLKAELEGFSTIDYPNISINIGRNTNIEVKLSAAVEDVITVTAESPLLDERRISTGATVASTELEKIPTARDPWAILQTTPGVLTDRINVGGNESGQQSAYIGPGSSGQQAVWSVDGVVITDMAALGASPAYYDFDAFEEMQVTTGGSDTTLATGGVVLNMVTKRGTNEWRGSGRYYNTNESRQSDTSFKESDLSAADCSTTHLCLYRSGNGQFNSQLRQFQLGLLTNGVPQEHFKQGNRIVSVKDYGAEVGGPIVKDRLWVWGSYGRNKISLLTISDVSDFTDLKSKNAKLNAQIAANNSATAFYFDSEKVKIGRNAGPTRPQETTWDQGHFGPSPTTYKVEDTHIFSSNFYLTGMYSKVNGGFELVPEGGFASTSPAATLGPDGVWHNSFELYQTERPQTQYKLDASNFFNTGSLSHELKFGAGYRKAEVNSLTRWGGGGYILDAAQVGLPTGTNYIVAARDSGLAVKQEYTDLYAQDTMTVGNLTANFGLRYDKQEATNLGASVPANPFFGSTLPATAGGSFDAGFDWTSITPRLGLTYALGAERKTLLRASYSRFADQLGTGTATYTNPLAGAGYAYFYGTQGSGPGGGPLNPALIIQGPNGFSSNVNPITHGLLNSNSVDSGLDAPLTDEVLLGVEHALLPEFVIGLNLTYRKLTNLLDADRLVFDGSTATCDGDFNSLECPSFAAGNLGSLGRRATRNDYEPVVRNQPMPDGSTRQITWFRLKPGVSTRGGNFLHNGESEQRYKGASLVFNKRLANRWMLRGNFTWADWTWENVTGDLENLTEPLGGGNRNGDPVLQGSGTGSGSKGGIYINSKWSYSVNGLYQIMPDRPWGFNLAANLTGREGYPLPYFWRSPAANARENFGQQNIQVTTDPDEFRLDDIHIMDARVEKEFTFSDFGLTVGVDVFNVFNQSYVLQRNHRLSQSTSDNVREIASPRIIRLGARFSFR